ncbi:MAG: winged helix-turn-helix domain-containing protein [Deltaproteobacteria bacterium]|nr:winged helix-turn-helix domain-containing protein [Deltaproteobacteria bacterium]
MSKVLLSKRARAVLGWVRESCHPVLDAGSSAGSRLGGRDDNATLPIRQKTLADLLGCSRRSIYRALKELKAQGYLVETGKRKNRCKVYQICSAALPGPCELKLAATQATSLIALRASEELPEAPKVSQESAAWTKEGRRSDAGPGEVRLCEQAKFYLDNCQTVFKYNFLNWPDWEKFFPEATHRIRHVEHQTKFWRLMFDNPDSTLFGVSYPKEPPKENLEHRMRTRPAYRSLR